MLPCEAKTIPEPYDPQETKEDAQELLRQENLFGHTAFDYINNEPDLARKNERLATVAELKQLARDVREETKTMADFYSRQDELMENSANTFLEELYPGLNVAGWRVMMALADPLAYGREIQLSSDVRRTISRRS